MASAAPPPGLPPWSGRYRLLITRHTLQRWGRTCHLCRQPGATTADHLIPRSKALAAGVPLHLVDDVETQLRPAHHGCNSVRGARSLEDWFARYPVRTRPGLAPSREW